MRRQKKKEEGKYISSPAHWAEKKAAWRPAVAGPDQACLCMTRRGGEGVASQLEPPRLGIIWPGEGGIGVTTERRKSKPKAAEGGKRMSPAAAAWAGRLHDVEEEELQRRLKKIKPKRKKPKKKAGRVYGSNGGVIILNMAWHIVKIIWRMGIKKRIEKQ